MNTHRPSFDVEAELAIAIEPIGGVRVTAVLGKKLGHKNADFLFPSSGVIAELKCLDEDKIADERIIEKASSLYMQELHSGRAPVVAFGTVQMTTEDFSEEYKQRIGNLYRVPIERLARDANQQIEETAKALKATKPVGLFLLANNNHTALDPQHAWYLVNQILMQDKYPRINTAVVFSGNLAAALPNAPNRMDYWIEIQRPNMPALEAAFLNSLREAWHARLATILGQPNGHVAIPISMAVLRHLESR
jgi:hypothetical protein